MADKKAASKFLETKYFGLVIGLLVFLLMFALSSGTVLVKSVEQKLLDLNFRFKNTVSSTRPRKASRSPRPIRESPRTSSSSASMTRPWTSSDGGHFRAIGTPTS